MGGITQPGLPISEHTSAEVAAIAARALNDPNSVTSSEIRSLAGSCLTQVAPSGAHIGLPVAGYKPQFSDAIAQVNEFKQLEEVLLRKLDKMRLGDDGADPRWLQIGRTGLEQAFMAINRSVFKPGRVAIVGDA